MYNPNNNGLEHHKLNENGEELRYQQQQLQQPLQSLQQHQQQPQYNNQQPQYNNQQLPQQLSQQQQQQLPFSYQQLNQLSQMNPAIQFQEFQRLHPLLPSPLSQQIPPHMQQQQQHEQQQQQLLNIPENPSSIPILRSSPDAGNTKNNNSNNNNNNNNNISPFTSYTPMRKSKSGTDFLNIDKECQFCQKLFSHKGSLIRHLDKKKGDPLHPPDQISALRSSQLRRRSVDNVGQLSSTGMELSNSMNKTIRKRRVSKKSMARSQMSSDSASGQKEKSKLRRKLRDRRIKAKILTNEWFLEQFTKQTMPDARQNVNAATFCHFVAFYLPLKNWPSLASSQPNALSFEQVLTQLQRRSHDNLFSTLEQSFQLYQQLNVSQQRKAWLTEIQQCLLSSISEFSLCDLNSVKSIIDKKEQSVFENICMNDNLSAYVDLDDNPTVEEEEEEEEGEGEDGGAGSGGGGGGGVREDEEENVVNGEGRRGRGRREGDGEVKSEDDVENTSSFTSLATSSNAPLSSSVTSQMGNLLQNINLFHQQHQQQQQPQQPPPQQTQQQTSYITLLPTINHPNFNDFNSSHFYQ